MELSLFKIIICSSLVLNSYLVKLVISEDISELSSVEYYNKSAVLERTKRFLFYPKNTIMQVTVGIAIPMDVPQRKVAVNGGFQMNIALPYTPEEFYNPPHWATRNFNGQTNTSSRSIRSIAQTKSNLPSYLNHLLPGDITTEDFYQMVQKFLSMYGFEDDCLEKAICEMAQHPLEPHNDNLMSELLHLIFSPSQHEDLPTDWHTTAHLHAAEEHGKNGAYCEIIYKCLESPLEHVTRLEEHEDNDDADMQMPEDVNEINP